MADVLRLQTAAVLSRIDAIKRIYPEVEDDVDLLAGMAEGSTELIPLLERLLDRTLDAQSHIGAVAERMENLTERRDRMSRKAEAYRAMILELMQASRQTSIVLPEATLSIAKGRATVVIEDASAVPQGFVRIERVPLKTDILAALKVGDQIPGARLEASPDYLTVRTK